MAADTETRLAFSLSSSPNDLFLVSARTKRATPSEINIALGRTVSATRQLKYRSPRRCASRVHLYVAASLRVSRCDLYESDDTRALGARL